MDVVGVSDVFNKGGLVDEGLYDEVAVADDGVCDEADTGLVVSVTVVLEVNVTVGFSEGDTVEGDSEVTLGLVGPKNVMKNQYT